MKEIFKDRKLIEEVRKRSFKSFFTRWVSLLDERENEVGLLLLSLKERSLISLIIRRHLNLGIIEIDLIPDVASFRYEKPGILFKGHYTSRTLKFNRKKLVKSARKMLKDALENNVGKWFFGDLLIWRQSDTSSIELAEFLMRILGEESRYHYEGWVADLILILLMTLSGR